MVRLFDLPIGPLIFVRFQSNGSRSSSIWRKKLSTLISTRLGSRSLHSDPLVSPKTLASACTGDPTMAASIGFLPAFTIGDGASAAALPRRAVLLPSFTPPRRWAVAADSHAAVEAAPDATGKRRPRGITKPRPVSPELQAVVGEAEIPRTQALKKIWAYIKENNLQVLFYPSLMIVVIWKIFEPFTIISRSHVIEAIPSLRTYCHERSACTRNNFIQ